MVVTVTVTVAAVAIAGVEEETVAAVVIVAGTVAAVEVEVEEGVTAAGIGDKCFFPVCSRFRIYRKQQRQVRASQ
jgi:hypothetical protein